MKCKKCSYDNDQSNQYCSKCGEKLEEPDPITLFRPTVPPAREMSRSGQLLKFTAMAVVLMVTVSVIIIAAEWKSGDTTKFDLKITIANVSNPMHSLPEARIALDLDNDGVIDESRYYRISSQSNGSKFTQIGTLSDYFEVEGRGRSFSYSVQVFCNGTTLFYNSALTVVKNQGTVNVGSSEYWKFNDYHGLYWCTMETGYAVNAESS